MLKRFNSLVGIFVACAFAAKAQTFNFTVNSAIPDGDPTGFVNVQTISSAPGQTIGDLNVSLSISGTGLGGFNGDLYVSLQHESGFSVLLNRPGRRIGTPQGYSDNGLNVTFDESAGRDIHNYRLELNGSHTTPIPGSLTDVWEPDARNIDPATVLDSSARSATLDSFMNLPVNGEWVLFVSDLSSGGTHTLNSWGMEMASPIPEPRNAVMAGALLLALFALGRKLPKGKQGKRANGR